MTEMLTCFRVPASEELPRNLTVQARKLRPRDGTHGPVHRTPGPSATSAHALRVCLAAETCLGLVSFPCGIATFPVVLIAQKPRPHPPGSQEGPASLPRQPLMEKPKKPSWHLSQAWPSTPGRQGHCPVSGWHWFSWEPSGWHVQL